MKGSKRRMEVFREIVKLTYNDRLKENIDRIPDMFNKKPGGITAVKNEALVAMGLNPTARADTELSREVDAALNLEEVRLPLVTINRNVCDECSLDSERECQNLCVYDNEDQTSRNRPIIENGKCLSCGRCIPRCPLGAISDKIEFVPMSRYFGSGTPVYAAVAPAVVGQFGKNVTMGKLRSALKSIGFADMLEVA
ncbi:MAG: 4Fe-4S binding protein, partial [Firmicutes bacterium]|nr:4Fe-4S binding protein [Bacillota bacterium]MDD3297526.1 4Fe-4S binding protein [Bacillota bacterium]MDD4707231.1 4Fe-4S binding protein [Bacillota bacterium]